MLCLPFVLPGARLAAKEAKATYRPSGESATPLLRPPACAPPGPPLAGWVVPGRGGAAPAGRARRGETPRRPRLELEARPTPRHGRGFRRLGRREPPPQ